MIFFFVKIFYFVTLIYLCVSARACAAIVFFFYSFLIQKKQQQQQAMKGKCYSHCIPFIRFLTDLHKLIRLEVG
jgi:hypothetical protein